MKAVQVTSLNERLEIRNDIPIPQPGVAELLVRITSSSLCASDVAAQQGVSPVTLPFCAGHEPVGIVVEVGPGVVEFASGDRVGFLPSIGPCHTCGSCRQRITSTCASPRGRVGFSLPYGGFSEYCLASVPLTVRIPPGLSDDEAAPLLCAGVTAYGALKKAARIQTGGTKISIIGCGGVGHLAIKYAKAMGFYVTAYDVSEEKVLFALKCGADEAINTTKDVVDGGKSTLSCLVISGSLKAYELAFRLTSPGGQVIAVGVPHSPLTIDVLGMVMNRLSFIATCQGDISELEEALSIAAQHGVKPEYEIGSLKNINEDYKRIRDGQLSGRIVYRIAEDPAMTTSNGTNGLAVR